MKQIDICNTPNISQMHKKDILCTFDRVLYQMIKQNLEIDQLIAWFVEELESFVQSIYCDVQSNYSGDKIIQKLFSTFSLFPK